MLDVQQFWRDGFLVIPKALDPQQVMRWRRAAMERENRKADLLTDPVLRDVVLNETLITYARDILGGQPIYFGDSTAAVGAVGWGFHKDNSDRLDAKAPDWKTDRYPIIRFGIYTKRHGGDEPGSIEFRRGSHLHADCTTGERVTAETEPGDLIVWNSRTTHSPNARIIRGIGYRPEPNIGSIPFRVLTRVKGYSWLMRQESEQRLAIFVSYGLASPLLDRHLEYLRARAYPWDVWEASHWSDESKAMAERRGLGLIDVTGFRRDPNARINVEYAPIPY